MTDKIKYEVGKEYKLGSRTVQVLTLNRPQKTGQPILAMDINDGILISCTPEGYDVNCEQLTEIKPWDTLKPGDLCMGDNTFPRVFAGIKKGEPATYDESLTDFIYWDTCRPLTEEELAKINKGV